MTVDDALISVYRVNGDLTGYTQVISPPIGNQASWVYIRDDAAPPDMQVAKGYWVFMVNARTVLSSPVSPSPRLLCHRKSGV